MKKVFVLLGGTVGGAIGWWLADAGGIFAAFIVSMIATGVGMYAGSRLAARILP